MSMTDKEAANRAMATFDSLSEDQRIAKVKIDEIIRSDSPFIDIHELFGLYNVLYFRSLLLPRVEVSWSLRLTSSAGTCELSRDPETNEYTRIRLKLSEPLLKFRPRGDTINTLLHEAIHAYFFVTTSWRHARDDDGTGHGEGFILLADAINGHGGYEVTIFHSFDHEVDEYRVHIWQCDGPCRSRAPSFGLVKKVMNRPPGQHDPWWREHEAECGGRFNKIGGPELSKSQLERMGGLKRAGRQKNKLDAWINNGPPGPSKRKSSPPAREDGPKRSRHMVECPICETEVPIDDMNAHLDEKHQE